MTMQASDRSLTPGTSLADLRELRRQDQFSPDLQHGVIGHGLNDLTPRIFSILPPEHGYDGWISIEDGVNGMDDLVASEEFLRRARDDYFGGSTAVQVRNHDESVRQLARNGELA